MIARVILELGPWSWMVLGFVLLGLEILLPGVFLVWIGMAAIAIGLLSLVLWDAAFWEWHVQVLLFLILSVAAAWLGNRLVRRDGDAATDEPLLNRRADALVGRTATLEEPIREGHGRIRLDDTVWRVRGHDMPVGARVRVVAAANSELMVERLS